MIYKSFLNQALYDKRAELIGEGKSERIRYVAAGRSERWTDPEEKSDPSCGQNSSTNTSTQRSGLHLSSVFLAGRQIIMQISSSLKTTADSTRKRNFAMFRLNFCFLA